MACIFCSIAKKEIPAEMLYETEHVFVIRDIHPKTKVHLLVIPKEHIETFNGISSKNADVMRDSALAIATVTQKEGINESGYKVVSNNGPDGGQEVPHLHLHILGGQPLRGLV